MNEYSSQTLTVEDLQNDERGTVFTDCVFEETAGGAVIENINFSCCLFNGCTWNVDVDRCNFKACEGDSLPPLTLVEFTEPLEEEKVIRAGHGLIKGDGVTTQFSVLDLDVEALEKDLLGAGLDQDDFAVTRGRVSHGTAWGNAAITRTEYLAQPILEMTTDAADSADPINGIPDIPADGASSCSISVRKKDRAGNYLTDASDNDTVDLECTRGKLSDLRIDLVNGEASVSLTSIAETCVSEVKAAAEGMEPVTIQIQFAP